MKRYETYKDSGVEWIGDIPDKWDMVSLKYSDDTIMGQSPNSDDYLLEPVNNSIPFLQGNAEFNELYPTPKLWCNTANKHSEINDILISVRAPIGAINISNQVYGIGRGLCAIRAVNHTFKYLYYFLTSANEYLNVQGTGSTFTAISTTVLRELKIPAITLKEQTQIANYLDYKTGLIDAIIAQKEELIKKLKEQRQAIISEAVTKGLNPNVKLKDSGIEWLGDIPEHWEAVKLKYVITELESGVSVNSESTSVMPNSDEYGILKTSAVFNYDFDPLENKSVVQNEYDRLKCPVVKDSIIISRMNTPDLVGSLGYVDKNYNNLFLPDRLWQTVIDDKSIIDVEFLSHILKSDLYRKIVSSKANGTSPSMKNITKSDLLETSIPFIPYQEQIEIKKHLNSIDFDISLLITKALKSIQKLKEYRKSLISEAVTGKIDVRNWQAPKS